MQWEQLLREGLQTRFMSTLDIKLQILKRSQWIHLGQVISRVKLQMILVQLGL